MRPELPKLGVRRVGRRFPRFVIRCDSTTFWTGGEWTLQRSKALLYAHLDLARSDLRSLKQDCQAFDDRSMLPLIYPDSDDFLCLPEPEGEDFLCPPEPSQEAITPYDVPPALTSAVGVGLYALGSYKLGFVRTFTQFWWFWVGLFVLVGLFASLADFKRDHPNRSVWDWFRETIGA